MNTQCIVYVTDKNFLFPTLVSAMQSRQHCRVITDVLVLLTENVTEFQALKDLMKVQFVDVFDYSITFSSVLGKLDDSRFQKKISKTAMGRLVSDQVLPEHYSQIIYIDGDTQICNSLERLEAFIVPVDKFLASPDYISINDFLNGADLSRYFNSGVLKFNREGWIGKVALEQFITDPSSAAGFHDQGVLNLVGKDSLIYISSEWNYPKQFLHLLPVGFKPAIVHYMAHPKPWHGVFFPWRNDAYDCYIQAKKDFPVIGKYFQDIPYYRKAIYKYRSIKSSLLTGSVDSARQRIKGLFDGDFAI